MVYASWTRVPWAPVLASTELSLGHEVEVVCEDTENGLQIQATAPATAWATAPHLPLDLVGRCKVRDRELAFVVTLARKDG